MAKVRPIPTKRTLVVQRWVSLVAAYEQSGLPLAVFAAQMGVKRESLGWWRRRVLATAPAFVEVSLPAVVAPSAQPEPGATRPVAVLRLEVPQLGVEVPVPVGTDLRWLREVLGALA